MASCLVIPLPTLRTSDWSYLCRVTSLRDIDHGGDILEAFSRTNGVPNIGRLDLHAFMLLAEALGILAEDVV